MVGVLLFFIYEIVRKYEWLTGRETVIDLYCGIGTITLYLSAAAGKVVGVEAVDEAVQAAVRNAEFAVGRVEEVISEIGQTLGKVDVIVLDPPRKGCKISVLEAADLKPERMIYVSCNPSTMARDLKCLMEKGYKPKEVQPVDMFPHTAHVESIIMMMNCGLKGK